MHSIAKIKIIDIEGPLSEDVILGKRSFLCHLNEGCSENFFRNIQISSIVAKYDSSSCSNVTKCQMNQDNRKKIISGL